MFKLLKYEKLPDILESWKELAFIIKPPSKEISDAFDITVEVPADKGWKT